MQTHGVLPVTIEIDQNGVELCVCQQLALLLNFCKCRCHLSRLEGDARVGISQVAIPTSQSWLRNFFAKQNNIARFPRCFISKRPQISRTLFVAESSLKIHGLPITRKYLTRHTESFFEKSHCATSTISLRELRPSSDHVRDNRALHQPRVLLAKQCHQWPPRAPSRQPSLAWRD